MTIHESMIAVMRDVSAIAKNRKNSAQGYQFRGIDDVYAALHDILAEHGIFTLPEVLDDKHEERTSKSGGLLIYRILKIRYTFMASDGTSVTATVIGEGQDSGDKASNKAMSVAHKYCLLQAFCIPTEDAKDPENDSPDPMPRKEVDPSIAERCKELVRELGISDTDKATQWKACGNSLSKYLAFLESMRAAKDAMESANGKLDKAGVP